MQDADLDGMVEGAEVLPDVVRDAVIAEGEEKFFAENTRERKGDVSKEDVGGTAKVVFAMEDVGDEGVGGVEGLAARLAGPLGGSEEVTAVDLLLKLEEEALLPDHAEDVAKGDAAVVDGVERVEGGNLA